MDTPNNRFKYYVLGGLLALILIVVGLEKLAANDPDLNPSNPSVGSDTAADTKIRGKVEAPVTLVEYSDFQCPACAAYHPLTKQLAQDFPDTLKIVFRHFPLVKIHPNAMPAARAAEAAHAQGKFWEMHDTLFEHQQDWAKQSDPNKTFVSYAQTLGLDIDKFQADINDSAIGSIIQTDLERGNQDDVPGTPTFFLNGSKLQSPQSYEEFKQVIEEAVKNTPTKTTEASEETPQTEAQTTLEHADFAVYINGKKANFAQPQYQSPTGQEKDKAIYLRDNKGHILHKHEAGATLGRFFKSLGMEFSNTCFTFDTGHKYCNTDTNTLRLFVNGQPNDQFESYEPKDLDRILITYGPKDTNVDEQLKAVTDEACIYSNQCPERGAAPEEE